MESAENKILILMKRITVMLAEDHMIVREGFRKMLELEDDLEVVGEAQDGRQAVTLAKKLRCACRMRRWPRASNA